MFRGSKQTVLLPCPGGFGSTFAELDDAPLSQDEVANLADKLRAEDRLQNNGAPLVRRDTLCFLLISRSRGLAGIYFEVFSAIGIPGGPGGWGVGEPPLGNNEGSREREPTRERTGSGRVGGSPPG